MMEKIWKGRINCALDETAEMLNSSIAVDSRMYEWDIKGSIAHATMLGATGIISNDERQALIQELTKMLSEINEGSLVIDYSAEDIHSFIEAELTKCLGNTGKKLHTARSRNDQVALDIRLTLLDEIKNIKSETVSLLSILIAKAEENTTTVMAGYTHMQQAQPVTFAHHLLAYASMLIRDIERLDDCAKRTAVNPLGSCALAGTTMPIDRQLTAKLLNLNGITLNSMDGVSDRDFVIELASVLSTLMMHLSRFSEEIILWSSFEFKYVELSDDYSTGSSIMPQKKNPDIAELVRGKTGRVYGNLIALLTLMKALPLAYNKDMQEDKEAIFDSIDTAKLCIKAFAKMLSKLTVNKDNMLKSAAKGFINATDVADYLVKKGMPFRDAYKLTGEIVAECVTEKVTLEELAFLKYQSKSALFDMDIFEAINLKTAWKTHSKRGPSTFAVKQRYRKIKDYLKLIQE